MLVAFPSHSIRSPLATLDEIVVQERARAEIYLEGATPPR